MECATIEASVESTQPVFRSRTMANGLRWLLNSCGAFTLFFALHLFVVAAEPVTISVHVDRGKDLGQSFGSLFELQSADGRVTIGAGFENLYNTYVRADRHTVQLFVRAADVEPELESTPLPRPTDVCGAYLVSRDGRLQSITGGIKVWDPVANSWSTDATAREGMRIGDGLMEWSSSTVRYKGRTILSPPKQGSYALFFYANGHLCFFHIDRQDRPYRPWTSDADGFSKLYACPWTPAEDHVALDKAIVYTLPIVGETTFAWGQFGSQVLTGSNVGGFYVFEQDRWRKLLDPNLKVSYQLYSSMSFDDRLLMGQYPTGRIFSYDGQTIVDQANWPPVLPGVVGSSREAQTTVIYGGYLYVGVWPWGELWRYSPDQKTWTFVRRMFDHPDISASVTHPYDVENKGNPVSNQWGQRVTSLVTVGSSLYVSTSAKDPCVWMPDKNPFLAPDKWKSYGAVYQLNAPGHLSAPVMWTDKPTRLTFSISSTELMISQDGRTLAKAALTGALSSRISAVKEWRPVGYGCGIYGAFGGKSVTPANQ